MALPDKILKAFHVQMRACERLGSPFTARLCRLLPPALAAETPVGLRVRDWAGDPIADALALRVCGGLQWLARQAPDSVLGAVFPPANRDDAALAEALDATLSDRAGELLPWLDRPPQTNEVARSGILLGGLLHIADRTWPAVELLEIGASAGVNLALDKQSYDLGEGRVWGPEAAEVRIACAWQGAPPPLEAPLRVVARAGCDAAPINAADPEARDRMLAYIWPDQVARQARARAALLTAAGLGIRVERADAGAWVPARLAEPARPATTRVVMHSIMWQYLPEATKEAIEGAIRDAGRAATPASSVAWLRLEPDGAPHSAAILLDLWPGDLSLELGRGDYHGRWAEWADV
ncbi:MAG: DUF2332 family protein [Pseudomonadota bacterium]